MISFNLITDSLLLSYYIGLLKFKKIIDLSLYRKFDNFHKI